MTSNMSMDEHHLQKIVEFRDQHQHIREIICNLVQWRSLQGSVMAFVGGDEGLDEMDG
jgi:hypothetical protein